MSDLHLENFLKFLLFFFENFCITLHLSAHVVLVPLPSNGLLQFLFFFYFFLFYNLEENVVIQILMTWITPSCILIKVISSVISPYKDMFVQPGFEPWKFCQTIVVWLYQIQTVAYFPPLASSLQILPSQNP
jgi:hypothetical protein